MNARRIFFRLCLFAAFAGLGFESAAAESPQRKFLTADSSKGRIAIVAADGSTEWEYRIGPLHDLHRLGNGHILFQTSWTRLVEVDPADNRVVWEYDSAKANGNAGKAVEVHAFQRLANGDTMIVESGVGRIIEVDAEGVLKKAIPLKRNYPSTHSDTRLARKLDNGHYLVAHERDGWVREYDPEGNVVWEYDVPLFGREPKPGHGPEAFGDQCFCAVRLKNGNTLIASGNGHSVIEVTPDREIVWKLEQRELPGIQLAWVTTLEVLPSGNIVIGNCHAGPEHPQIVEITRDKQVVWTFRDFERFGDATTNTQILEVDGKPVRGAR